MPACYVNYSSSMLVMLLRIFIPALSLREMLHRGVNASIGWVDPTYFGLVVYGSGNDSFFNPWPVIGITDYRQVK